MSQLQAHCDFANPEPYVNETLCGCGPNGALLTPDNPSTLYAEQWRFLKWKGDCRRNGASRLTFSIMFLSLLSPNCQLRWTKPRFPALWLLAGQDAAGQVSGHSTCWRKLQSAQNGPVPAGPDAGRQVHVAGRQPGGHSLWPGLAGEWLDYPHYS